MKRHASCVPVFACLVFCFLFALSLTAIAQGISLAPHRKVLNNLCEKPWQLNQDPANAQPPASNDSNWQRVGLPYSADQMTMFINEESGGGQGDLGAGINWYRKHFT